MTLIQTITKTGGSPQTTASFISTNGNTLIIAAGQGSASGGTITVSDNKGNAFTRAVAREQAGASGNTAEIWYASNIVGGAGHTVTIEYSIASSVGIAVEEWSGLLTSGVLDKVSGQTAGGTPVTSGYTAVTSYGDELVVGVTCGNSGDTGVGSGFSNYTQIDIAGHPLSIESKTVSTQAQYQAEWTGPSSNTYAAVVATFIASDATSTSTSSTSASTTSASTSSTSSSISTSTSNSTSISTSTTNSTSTSSTSTSSTSTSTTLIDINSNPQTIINNADPRGAIRQWR